MLRWECSPINRSEHSRNFTSIPEPCTPPAARMRCEAPATPWQTPAPPQISARRLAPANTTRPPTSRWPQTTANSHHRDCSSFSSSLGSSCKVACCCPVVTPPSDGAIAVLPSAGAGSGAGSAAAAALRALARRRWCRAARTARARQQCSCWLWLDACSRASSLLCKWYFVCTALQLADLPRRGRCQKASPESRHPRWASWPAFFAKQSLTRR